LSKFTDTNSLNALKDLHFQPEQLKSARRLRALSLQDLADKLSEVGISLSKQAISKYEQGIVPPSAEMIDGLAKVLAVPKSYLFHTDSINLDRIAFRKLAKYSNKEYERIVEVVKIELSKYIELEGLLNIDSEFRSPVIPNFIKGLEDIEIYADALREEWELGMSPIANVIETLEDNNVKVIQVNSDVELDGFSTKANDKYPVVVLNKTKLDEVQDRKRWTALHELGHLLLQFDENISHKEEERFCHYFAGAMLFPKENLFEELGEKRSKLSFQELGELKQEYGISMQAIVYRAKELNVISESYYRQFFFLIRHLGFKEKEPVTYSGKKASSRFDQLLFKALAEDIISVEKAAEYKGITVEAFKKEYSPF
jgi:Zn-dependent peptidase ImmA (M78 family)/DNA-binding XRE family transcriptional regulator